MKKLELYLAHPFLSRKAVRDWELSFEKKSGINLLNPFYDSASRETILMIDSGVKVDRDPMVLVEGDLKFIQSAEHGMLAIVDGAPSYGTIQEIVYAKAVFKKKVFIIITNGKENHHWLRYHADEIFTSFEAFEDWYMKNFSE